MPAEASRVAGVSYSLMNLGAFLDLAIMSRNICAKQSCSQTLEWNRESPASPVGWFVVPHEIPKQCNVVKLAEKDVDSCRQRCLQDEECDALAIRTKTNNGKVIWCKTYACEGTLSTNTVPESRGIELHRYTAGSDGGRGSMQKAFHYMLSFANGTAYQNRTWLEEHPTTDPTNVSPGKWKRLALYARMIASSLPDSMGYAEISGHVDEEFKNSWENLVFPLPSQI
jgi:hypothetical protein